MNIHAVSAVSDEARTGQSVSAVFVQTIVPRTFGGPAALRTSQASNINQKTNTNCEIQSIKQSKRNKKHTRHLASQKTKTDNLSFAEENKKTTILFSAVYIRP